MRALNWSDVSVRRAAIAGAVLLAVVRAVKFAKDPRVAECVDALKQWCKSKDIDLKAVRQKAQAAAYAAAYAVAAAADAADARKKEQDQQRADIIKAFPPVVLKEK